MQLHKQMNPNSNQVIFYYQIKNQIQYGVSYLRDPFSVHFTIIDFSDFQCCLCARGRVNFAIKP
jgi:hypothetical protein